MTLLRTFAASFVVLTALQCTAVSASNCTEDEQSTIDSVYATLANGTACSDLMADSGVSSLDYCMQNDCISELSTAVEELPACTGEDGAERKTGLQSIVDYCADVTEVTDQSASGSGPGNDPVVSAASRDVLATSAVITQLFMMIYFVAALS
uniref:Elicitin-like protein n=1 Tax=Hyaloperonospora arabidopsidis (strain Emoy2) TaxID=559515 RepID=M4BUG6_HYAAE